MILVNDQQSHRVCLVCGEPFQQGDEAEWMSRHADCAARGQDTPGR